jgi:hypothetical protein
MLGPLVVGLMGLVTGRFVTAYDLFTVLCLAAGGYLTAILTRGLQDR